MGADKPGLIMNTMVGAGVGGMYGSVVSAWTAPPTNKLDGIEIRQDALPSLRTMWKHVGRTRPSLGVELQHPDLAKALEKKLVFNVTDWTKFGIAELKVPRPCAPGSLISMIICQVMKEKYGFAARVRRLEF